MLEKLDLTKAFDRLFLRAERAPEIAATGLALDDVAFFAF